MGRWLDFFVMPHIKAFKLRLKALQSIA